MDVQPTVDLHPRVSLDREFEGQVVVEAATLVHDREGPARVIAGVLDADGRRGWATSVDPAVFTDLVTVGLVGRPGHHAAGGTLEL
ncbi:MAG: hypothetical protein ABWZ99_06015 [Ilumatobacteraceae bacterium]